MRSKAIVFIICFFSLTEFFSQNLTINDIDNIVLQMKNNLGDFEIKEKTDTDTANKVFYFKDGEIRIIVVKELKRIEKEVIWYYKNQKLIYTETLWRDADTKKKAFHEKTYHNFGSLIAWMNTESKFVSSTSPEFIRLDKQLAAYSARIREEAMEE